MGDASEAAVDWNASATIIDRQIRAFDPAPGAYASFGGRVIKLSRAEPAARSADAAPGTVIEVDSGGACIACADSVLLVREVQPAGGRRMPAAAFLAGRRLGRGARFGSGAAAAA